jgi:hypothetical protein
MRQKTAKESEQGARRGKGGGEGVRVRVRGKQERGPLFWSLFFFLPFHQTGFKTSSGKNKNSKKKEVNETFRSIVGVTRNDKQFANT